MFSRIYQWYRKYLVPATGWSWFWLGWCALGILKTTHPAFFAGVAVVYVAALIAAYRDPEPLTWTEIDEAIQRRAEADGYTSSTLSIEVEEHSHG